MERCSGFVSLCVANVWLSHFGINCCGKGKHLKVLDPDEHRTIYFPLKQLRRDNNSLLRIINLLSALFLQNAIVLQTSLFYTGNTIHSWHLLHTCQYLSASSICFAASLVNY